LADQDQDRPTGEGPAEAAGPAPPTRSLWAEMLLPDPDDGDPAFPGPPPHDDQGRYPAVPRFGTGYPAAQLVDAGPDHGAHSYDEGMSRWPASSPPPLFGQHSAASRPTDSQPAAQHSTGQQPAAQPPTGQHPTGQQPAAQHPTGQQPAAQPSTGQQPMGQPYWADPQPGGPPAPPRDSHPALAEPSEPPPDGTPAARYGPLAPHYHHGWAPAEPEPAGHLSPPPTCPDTAGQVVPEETPPPHRLTSTQTRGFSWADLAGEPAPLPQDPRPDHHGPGVAAPAGYDPVPRQSPAPGPEPAAPYGWAPEHATPSGYGLPPAQGPAPEHEAVPEPGPAPGYEAVLEDGPAPGSGSPPAHQAPPEHRPTHGYGSNHGGPVLTGPGGPRARPGAWEREETADSLTADMLLPGRHLRPASGWRRVVYQVSGGIVRAPQSAAERRREQLTERARTPVNGGHHRVAVLSLKGGVGKTTTTMGLGSTLASVRGDRVIAVDANPDRGTLCDKLRLETAATVRDLLNERDQIERYADIRAYTTQAPSRLEVLASDRDPTVSVAFGADDYQDVAEVLEHFYSICVTDCGTGLLHSAMAGVLQLTDQIVLVSSASVDGARSASATLDWLAAHNYGDLVRGAVVVLSAIRPRNRSTLDLGRLEEHFAARCRAVVKIPYDAHLAEGAEVDLERLGRATADAYLVLAAEVGDGFAWPRYHNA
jgi:MinD-like ATPase involved in chromosome partitioning or flagellar assembly